MRTAVFIPARRASAEIEVKATAAGSVVTLEVPNVGRAPALELEVEVGELREALDHLAPSVHSPISRPALADAG